MNDTRTRKTLAGSLVAVALVLITFAGCPNLPQFGPTLTVTGIWGSPTIIPGSFQVMMTPTVMNLGQLGGLAQVVFVSFTSASDAAADQNGVLRVIDRFGTEIARFPDPSNPQPVPFSCSAYANFATQGHLSPISGVALGKLQANQSATIIGVLDNHTNSNAGIAAFRLVGNNLVPQWCSQPLATGDTIPRVSAPVIAQLDPPNNPPSIIVDNKVYDSFGHLRFSGGNCLTCPRSRTPIVVNLGVTGALPQIISGPAIYSSSTGWTTASVTPLAGIAPNAITYAAIADLDLTGQPKIVMVDAQTTTLHVFSAAGAPLASRTLPNSGGACGGPPMVGDADGVPGPEIGVATCTQYTVFKYTGTIGQVWTMSISDPSGDTTSTLFRDRTGVTRIYYADATTLWVFDGRNGTVLQSVPNSSATAIEGPIIASFDAGGGSSALNPGRLVLSANNFNLTSGGQAGIRIFSDPGIAGARSVWGAHNYHQTDIASTAGDIPVVEPPSWQIKRNSYRVQEQ
jgi:hypothetical protein